VPEGDTISRAATALRAALLGKPTTSFEARRHTGIVPVTGAMIERVESFGKHLEIGWDDGVVLHTHMRMTGSWHLYRPGERWRKSARQMRAFIEVPGWQAICFSAPVVETYRAREFSAHPGLGSLGPDLTKLEVDVDDCVDRMARHCDVTTTVAEALLDQRVACGVGNVYKSEVLWACEVHPRTLVAGLADEQRHNLIVTAARLLQINTAHVDRITMPGVPGGLAVYGRLGKPCLRCNAPIEVDRHGEQARVTYWCPQCQLLLSPPELSAAPGAALPKGWWKRDPQDAADTATDQGDEPMRVMDPHPAARLFLAGRERNLEPASIDPLFGHHSVG
jgi:endonuclease-8